MSNTFGSVNIGLTALANNTQVGAFQLPSWAYLNQFTTCVAAANSCLLPANPTNGQICKVRNDCGIDGNEYAPLNVFPQVGGEINSFEVNTPFILPVGGLIELISIGSLNWLVSGGNQILGNNVNIIDTNTTDVVNDVILSSDSCGVINITSAGENITITLPNPLAGLHYRFSLAGTAHTNPVNITATAVIIFGIFFGGTTVLATNTSSTTISFAGTDDASAGDWIDLYCDGTVWHGIGFGATAACFTRA